MMTLDYAQEAFRANPTRRTAMTYARAAKQYYTDDMIGDATVSAVAAELERTGFKDVMLQLMK